MGDCKYCGKPAGFLKRKHKECETVHQEELRKQETERREAAKRFNEGVKLLTDTSYNCIINNGNLDGLALELRKISEDNSISKEFSNKALVDAWSNAVETFLDDSLLTNTEEKTLVAFRDAFELTNDALDRDGSYTKVVKAGILRDILEGTIPERVKLEGTLPFNLQKKEKVIWLFNDVTYYEQKTRKQYVGRSSGVSIRIAKGVYYRTSAFKGYPVETQETVMIGVGIAAITNKHFYFSCPNKAFRIAINKIVTITPHSDGVTLQRDASTAKPQSFTTGDGWFTYNLLTNLSQN